MSAEPTEGGDRARQIVSGAVRFRAAVVEQSRSRPDPRLVAPHPACRPPSPRRRGEGHPRQAPRPRPLSPQAV